MRYNVWERITSLSTRLLQGRSSTFTGLLGTSVLDRLSDAMLNVPGYSIELDLRFDRTDNFNGIGGGLIVYVENNLIIKPVTVISEFNMFVQFGSNEIITSKS